MQRLRRIGLPESEFGRKRPRLLMTTSIHLARNVHPLDHWLLDHIVVLVRRREVNLLVYDAAV